jgi:hypothetical protein
MRSAVDRNVVMRRMTVHYKQKTAFIIHVLISPSLDTISKKKVLRGTKQYKELFLFVINGSNPAWYCVCTPLRVARFRGLCYMWTFHLRL